MSVALNLSHEPISGINHGKMSMWAFLASEIMFFTGFFGAFIVLRNSNIDVFMSGASHLNYIPALINTAALIISSLTMALAILNLENGRKKGFQLFLALTILCAFVFLGVKYYEYSHKFHDGIFPWTSVFFSFYFLMTGFHALHVIAGIIPMVWIYIRSFSSKGYTNHHRVEVLGLYWHFVDLVWIFLFPVLYLLFPGAPHAAH